MNTRRGFLAALLGASTMPTIYRWLNPVTVDQARYDSLITRVGYFASPTAQPNLDTPVPSGKSVLNIADYKDIDPTGVKDATATIQTAMNKAVAAGQELYIGPGIYTITSLNVPTGLVLRGYQPSGTGTDLAKQTRFGLKNGTNDHMLKGAVGSMHVRISNIHFDGNKNNNTSGDIINLADAGVAEEGQWHIRDCFLDAAAGYGVYVGAGRRAVQISDSSICYSRLSGIRMNGSDGHIDRCILGTNLEHGVGIGGTVCNVNDCDIYGNGTVGDTNTGDGITIYSTITLASIRGNRIDQNRRHGVLVSGSCEAITVSGNMFHGNSQHANGSHHAVSILSTTGSITVANNVIGVDGNVSNKSGYAINLAASATCQGAGNVIQAGAVVNGITNAPKRCYQTMPSLKHAGWEPTAAVLSNMDRATALLGNVASVALTGRLTLAGGMVIPANMPISSISFLLGNTALGTPTNQWFCLVDQAGNVLAKTVDDGSTGWSGNAIKTLALTATYTPTKDMPVYCGILLVGGTMPDFRAANASSPVYQLPPIVTGVANTGLTNPASLGSTIGAITSASANPYCYVS